MTLGIDENPSYIGATIYIGKDLIAFFNGCGK